MAGVESMSVRAFSAETGMVSAEGRLIIEMPEAEFETEAEAAD